MPEDLKAWTIIIIKLVIAVLSKERHNKTILNLIWATDEKAIIFFMSVVCKQVIPIKETLTSPIKQIKVITLSELVNIINRIIPIPPSFSRIPAKIIDPYTGASTWARGNQRCKENKGNFTKNLNITARLILIL